MRPTLNIETSPDSPDLDRLKLDEEEPTTARPVPAFHYPTRIPMSSAAVPTTHQEQDFDSDWLKLNGVTAVGPSSSSSSFHYPTRIPMSSAAEQDFDSDWLKLTGGIVTFDIDDDEHGLSPKLPQPTIIPLPHMPPETDLLPSTPGRRRSLFSLWRKDPNNVPTTTSDVQPADTFETHAKQCQPDNMGNNRNWVFKRSFVEEQKDMLRRDRTHKETRHPEREDGKTKRAEVWTVPGIEGVFLLKRVFTGQSSSRCFRPD